MMLEYYTFKEISSRTIEVDGEQVRAIRTQGEDKREGRVHNSEYLNVDGEVHIPLMEYFQAGLEGKIPEVIKEKVIGKDNRNEEEQENTEEENAE